MRKLKAFLTFAIFIQSAEPVWAGGIYTFRSTVDFVAAADDNPSVNGLGIVPNQAKNFKLVYGLYPSIFMNYKAPRVDFQLSYALGVNRVGRSELDLDSESQAFEGNVNAALTQNLKMRFSDTYIRSPDFITFNLFRGTTVSPEGLFPRSDIAALRTDSQANTASVSFDYTFNPKSALSFALGQFIRNYEKKPVVSVHLSDQTASNGSLLYVRRINQRTSWNLGYSLYQYNFRDFDGARTHNADIGISHQMSKSLSASLSAGPAYTESLKGNSKFPGYNASLSITKSFENDRISLTYHRRSGSSFGIGSISDTQDLGVYYFLLLGRRTTLNSAVSLYNARQRLDNPVASRGVAASLALNLILNSHWALNLGGSYQKQKGTDIFDVERRRIFVSIRFILPEFLRFEK
ncbi:MAG TPA: hypothetical protein VGL91_08155 [Acidobacteriota bacterium]|jgi:hypothetical protein